MRQSCANREQKSKEGYVEQSPIMSLMEAVANVVVGYGIAVPTQLIVFPGFGLLARVGDALANGGIFTVVSIARSFVLRRLFGGCACDTKSGQSTRHRSERVGIVAGRQGHVMRLVVHSDDHQTNEAESGSGPVTVNRAPPGIASANIIIPSSPDMVAA